MARSKFLSTLFLLLMCGANGTIREFHDYLLGENVCSICKCSSIFPESPQSISCKSISLRRIVISISKENIESLKLENIEGFHHMEPIFFKNSEFKKLAIIRSRLLELPEFYFSGLKTSLKELALSMCDLQFVPLAINDLENIATLDLNGNYLTSWPSDISWGFKNSLKMLILANNSIMHLNSDTFKDLPVLTTLDLQSNRIFKIYTGAFKLPSLNTLILSDNQLNFIPYEEISSLLQLQHLSLSKNIISQIVPLVHYNGKHISLDTLRLDHNIISDITFDAFKYFNKINTIILDGNPINSIMLNESVNNITKFGTISLRKCKLTEESLSSLKSFKLIIFSSENVSRISLQNFNLNYLEIYENDVNLILQVSSNTIKILPYDVFQYIKDLKFLYINKNKLQNVTANYFKELINLLLLDLSENEIEFINPDAFQNLNSIETLSLDSNNLTFLPDKLLLGKDQLESFSLKNNLGIISKLPNGFLCNLKSLNKVILDNSNIQNIEEGVFWGSKRIKIISLGHNLLVTIPSSLFRDQIELRELYFNHNKISYLPEDAFNSLKKLKTLDLSNNYLKNIQVKPCIELQILKLSNNGFNQIYRETFGNNKNLKSIDLSFNNLTLKEHEHNHYSGEQSVLSRLNAYKFLNLSHNRVNIIFEDWKEYNYDLTHLDLSYNLFTKINFESLLFKSNNVEINLSHNNIQKINFEEVDNNEIYKNYPKASNNKILIGYNPFNCDNDMYEFIHYLRGNVKNDAKSLFKIIHEKANCHSPENLKNRPLSSLDKCDMMSNVDSSVCPANCNCFYRKCDHYQLIICSAQNMKLPMNLSQSEKYKDLELHFENSSLENIFSLGLNKKSLNSIKKLYVSGNNISKLTVDDIPDNLKVIDLRDNFLNYIDSEIVSKLENGSLKEMYFSGNPIVCDCKNLPFLTFLQDNYYLIKDFKDVKCINGDKVQSILLGNLCSMSKILIAIIIFLALSVFIIGIFIAIYYKYQQEIKVWLFAKGWLLGWITDIDEDKTYDAFLSWSHKDDDFVINKLLPELESGPNPFKICVHYRDWEVGEMISTQITRTIMDSKRTIVVLSPNFLESVWGILEFKIAHCRALEEGRTRVIVIRYGDIGPTEKLDEELQAYLSTNTYLEWGDPRFWQKLRYALPHLTLKKSFKHSNKKDDPFGIIQPPSCITPILKVTDLIPNK